MTKYKEASIENIDKKIRKRIASLVTADMEKKKFVFNKGLFLSGGTGTGKTYILYAIKHRTGGRSSLVIENWVDLLIDLRSDLNMLRSRIDSITDKEIIMIDDLGAEKMTEWSQEILYSIVNRAYERKHMVFIATNLTIEQFEERYGDRIFSRLAETCEVLEIKGEDRRLK